MNDKAKQALMIAIAVVAVGVAAVVGFQSMNRLSPKEEIVGELPMPEGGGKAAEMGEAQADPSGMPPGMAESK